MNARKRRAAMMEMMNTAKAAVPITYLLRDEFTTADDAPVTSPRTCEPGPGTLTFADTGNTFSIAGGDLVWSTPGGAWGTGFVSGSFAAKLGLGFFSRYKPSVSNGACYPLIVSSSNSIPASAQSANNRIGWYHHTALTRRVYAGATQLWGVAFHPDLTDFGVILRAAGQFVLSKNYQDAAWQMIVSAAGNASPVYLMTDNHSSAGAMPDVSVYDLSALSSKFTTDTGLASVDTTNPGAGAEATMPPDAIVEFTRTIEAGDIIDIEILRIDDNNSWIVRFNQTAGTIAIYHKVAGVEDAGSSAVQAWGAGTPLTIRVYCYLNNIVAEANGVQKVTRTDAYPTSTATGVKVNLAGSKLIVWPVFITLPTGAAVSTPATSVFSAANAASALAIPSYDGSNKVVHPSVYYNAAGWNGKKYWMAFTPFPSAAAENPSMVVSDDGTTWTVPAGLTNPIEAQPAGGAYNSDPEIVVDGSGKMWLFWRVGLDPTGDTMYVRSSTDGVTWADKVQLFTGAYNTLASPSVFWDGSQWVMLYRYSTTVWCRRTCATPDGTWSDAVAVRMAIPPSQALNHLSICKAGSTCYAFSAMDGGKLWMATSADNGLNWRFHAVHLLDKSAAGWDNGVIYRASALWTGSGFDLFYSARSSLSDWKIGRTTVSVV